MMLVARWAIENDPTARIFYVFEAGDDHQADANKFMQAISDSPNRRAMFRYEDHAFVTKKGSKPTQAADILAWHACKQWDRENRNIFQMRGDFYELASKVPTRKFILDREEPLADDSRQHAVGASGKGTSWTLRSKHLRQPDGFAHAVDLVPIIHGALRWDWPGCRRIALAMAEASDAFRIPLRWGGIWDRRLAEYATSYAAIERESAAYVARRRAQGKRAAIDGPHFELIAEVPNLGRPGLKLVLLGPHRDTH